MRTKYQFKDRAEAEAAYRREESKQIEYSRGLNATLRGDVAYLPMIGPFKLGLFWLERGNGHVLLQQPRSNGASAIVMDCEDFFKWADGEAIYDADLRKASFHARRVRSAVWKGATLADAIKEEKEFMRA